MIIVQYGSTQLFDQGRKRFNKARKNEGTNNGTVNVLKSDVGT